MKLLSARLVFMNEGDSHMFTRGNNQIPDSLDSNRWPVPLTLNNFSFRHQEGSVDYNGWIGQTWSTALVWAKAKWPVRRFGWKDKEITWEGSLLLNGSPWIPEDGDLDAEDWMIGGNGEEGGGDPGIGPEFTNFLVNGASFGIKSGFPTFLFEGAIFQIVVSKNALWTCSNKNAEVVGGTVTLKKRGDFTIRATSANGLFSDISFTDKTWLIPSPDQIGHSESLDTAWILQQGGRLPTSIESTLALVANEIPTGRKVGTITSEWGDLSVFGWRKWRDTTQKETEYFPTSTTSLNSKWFIGVQNGKITRILDTDKNTFTPVALIIPFDPSKYSVKIEASYNRDTFIVAGTLVTAGISSAGQTISVQVNGWVISNRTVTTDSSGNFSIPNVFQEGSVTLSINAMAPEGLIIPATKTLSIDGFDQPSPNYIIATIRTEVFTDGNTWGYTNRTPSIGVFKLADTDISNNLNLNIYSGTSRSDGTYFTRFIFDDATVPAKFKNKPFKLRVYIEDSIREELIVPVLSTSGGEYSMIYYNTSRGYWEDLKGASEVTRTLIQFI